MEPLFTVNGLMFWTAREIRLRRMMAEHFAAGVSEALRQQNPAWQLIEIEAPLLTPRDLLNPNYTEEDIWVQADDGTEGPGHRILALRPETTPGSYLYAQHLLKTHSGYKPPLCVWQTGKSFRREQDQVTKNMRLKEFHQQEFQCLYTADTMNDYHAAIQEPVRQMIAEMVPLPTRLVESDRLPAYSQITVDVEVDNGDKWMEVCSISRRIDFPDKVTFPKKGGGVVERAIVVLEVAIGLDRLLYNLNLVQRGAAAASRG